MITFGFVFVNCFSRYLQHGSLPVINPLGERFPSSFYISQSQLKSLHTISDNHTLSSSLRNPRSGHWYGVASLPKTETKLRPAVSTLLNIGPDKDSLCTKNCIYFLTHQFKHVFWVFKRTVSLRRFF